jgi:ATP synthase protein I
VACSQALSQLPVDPSDSIDQSISPPKGENHEDSPPPESDRSLGEFHQLKVELITTTLILTVLIFGPVWYFYSLNLALNYLIGACTGVVYLRLLAKNVEQLGQDNQRIGKSQLAVFIGVIIVATQWNQLHVLPVFLGFLTFKAAIIVYMLRTAVFPQ